MRNFDPANEARAYRQALGRYATGVSVITTQNENALYGITANSFASVSLDPPIILWSPDKKSKRHDVFANAKHFAVHVLSAEQRDVCDGFSRSAFAFDELSYSQNIHGVPIINDCLAVLECEYYNSMDGGDHTIVLGQVKKVHCREDGNGLIFAHGKFATV